jgi:hypothetical protein
VTLLSGKRTGARRRLDSSCVAHFYPWVSRPTSFRASIAADSTYLAATSRKLRIRVAKPHRRR